MATRTPAPQPRRALAIMLLALIGLYAGVAFGKSHTPRLGLDLRGGTSLILKATQGAGRVPSHSALQQAVNVLRNRINGTGVTAATVTTAGNDLIQVQVPGTTDKTRHQLVAEIEQTAQLRFRLVLSLAPSGVSVQASPSPTHSAHPSPSVRPRSSRSASPRPTALGAFSLAGYATKAAPRHTPTPTPKPSPLPSVPIGTGDFTSLQTAELAYLHFTCKSGSDNPTSGNDNPGDYIVACGALNGQVFKFLLGPAKVFGNEISSANTAIDSTGAWIVDLTFNSKGTTDWGNLTTEASKLQTSGCGPPAGCNYIAVVLDGVVNSWPTVNQGPILSGNTQITNIGGQTQAQALANVLKYGSLPVHVHLQQDETVSPTLGSDQLRGGLIAGAIGLGLVIVYSLLYYRGLGFVTIASLALSGALLYALVTILGVALGYTLTLAGIAGFIVAVGITADSFVVFFERMRDVRREGRSLRSSVEFAWPRARRTILSADTVSILAAAVLYLLSIGDVRGFAFTLGLSTICDLFIVFLFTKPLLTLLVNTRFYQAGGRFTGLGDERIGSAPPPRVLAGRQG